MIGERSGSARENNKEILSLSEAAKCENTGSSLGFSQVCVSKRIWSARQGGSICCIRGFFKIFEKYTTELSR